MQFINFVFSVLRTFIHDPLVEWRRKSKTQKMNPADTELAQGEIHNDQVSRVSIGRIHTEVHSLNENVIESGPNTKVIAIKNDVCIWLRGRAVCL